MALQRLWANGGGLIRCLQEVVSQRCLVSACSFHSSCPQSNSNRTSIVRHNRQKYERMYPVLLVRPDGSTINIRYREPKKIILMPVDLTTLSDEERKARMRKKRAKKIKNVEDDFEDTFKVEEYSKFWKKT